MVVQGCIQCEVGFGRFCYIDICVIVDDLFDLVIFQIVQVLFLVCGRCVIGCIIFVYDIDIVFFVGNQQVVIIGDGQRGDFVFFSFVNVVSILGCFIRFDGVDIFI